MSDIGNRLPESLPSCDLENPADVESWFGMFGFAETWRKCVLSNCREIIRATMTAKGEKISEARIDDLARTHPNYLSFLTDSLRGRQKREENLRQSIGI